MQHSVLSCFSMTKFYKHSTELLNEPLFHYYVYLVLQLHYQNVQKFFNQKSHND